MLLQYGAWYFFFPDLSTVNLPSFDFLLLTAVHVLLLAFPILAAVFFFRKIHPWSREIALILILSQVVSLVFQAVEHGSPSYDFYEYTIQEREKFTFASDENVVVLIVDAMGENLCKDMMKRYPETVSMLRDFTCFDQMKSPIPRTCYAVPAIMTGVEYPAERNPLTDPDDEFHARYLNQAFRSERSLFRAFKAAGFRSEAYPFYMQTICYTPELIDNSMPMTELAQRQSILKIYDVVLGRQVPFFLKPLLMGSYYQWTDPFIIPQDFSDSDFKKIPFDIQFYQRLKNEFRKGNFPKGFKYLHIQGAHDPVRTDEQLLLNPNTLKVNQLRGSFRIVETLLLKLKDAGLYENATIVIMGDHTEMYTPDVLAFIKRKGDRREKILFNSVPCKVSEIAGTVLNSSGIVKTAPSLFDKKEQAGKQNKKTDGMSLNFDQWKILSEPISFEEKEVGQNNFLIQDQKILVDLLNLEHLETSTFYFRNLKTGVVLTNSRKIRKKNYRYYQCSLAEIPDGNYQIFLEELRPGSENTLEQTTFSSLSRFLVMKNGKGTLTEDYPDCLPRPMLLGEKINFHPMKPYPQLLFSRGSAIRNNALKLGQMNPTFRIRLPKESRNFLFNVVLRCSSAYEGEVLVSTTARKELGRYPTVDQSPVSIRIPVNSVSGSESEILTLRFDFIPKRSLRDSERAPVKIEILSLELRKSSEENHF